MPNMGETDPLGYVLAEISAWGHLGVVVFNIVSGFVLSLPYLGEPRIPAPGHMAFLKRRFFRILPNYWIALVFWSLILLASSESLASMAWPFLAHLFFLHSFSSEFFFSIVPAYWWLGLLAQFYLVFPILLKLFRRWGALRCLLTISAGCWGGWLCLHVVASRETAGILASLDYLLYFNLPARLPEFAAGMWLASVHHQRLERIDLNTCSFAPSTCFWDRLFIVTGLLLVLAGFLVDRNQLPLYHPYLSIWCFLLVGGLLGSPRAANLGRLAAVAGLARISYNFYLLHQPILGYGALFLEKIGLGSTFWPFFLVGTALVTTVFSLGLDKLLRKAGWLV